MNDTVKAPVIICVDDEKIILDSLSRQLQRHFGNQYEYEFCESAQEALTLIEELSKENYKVIMVISDQIMPGISGDELLIKLQAEYPDTIKILLTGQASLESAIEAINKANLYRYIKKPWNESDFLLTVAKGLQEYNLLECTLKQAEVFEKFVPKRFLECISRKDILEVQLSDHTQREMSIMFSDIRHFTSISENMTPEENYHFINDYLKFVEPAIQSNNGFVDKYIGDAIIALFHHADDAMVGAIHTQGAMKNLNTEHAGKPYFPVVTGIGLHIGSLMLGIVGVETHMQGTVISDAVNIASRLQDLAALYDLRIVISNEFFEKISNPDTLIPNRRFLGSAFLKGKKQSTAIWEVILPECDPHGELKMLTLTMFHEGVELFRNKQFAEACVKFKAVKDVNPDDKVNNLYLSIAAEYMLKGVPESWESSTFVV